MIDFNRADYEADIKAGKYCQFVPKHERPVITRLLKAALKDRHTISIHDGEELVLSNEPSLTKVRAKLGHTGEDEILVMDADGECIGWFHLIYDNGSEDYPKCVISNFIDNDFCNAVWEGI